MRHLEDSFVGSGGIKLYYQGWYPDKVPKAVIQLIHGFLEHGGRYMDVANELVEYPLLEPWQDPKLDKIA